MMKVVKKNLDKIRPKMNKMARPGGFEPPTLGLEI